jgi:hypothetical protein
MSNTTLFLITISAIVLTRIYSDYRAGALKDKAWWFFGLPINLLIPTLLVAAYFLLDVHALWGMIALTNAAILNILFVLTADFGKKFNKYIIIMAVFGMLNVVGLGLATYLPDAFVKRENTEITNIDIEFITKKIQSIETSFITIRSKIEEEEQGLRSSLRGLLQKISTQQEALEQLSKDKTHLEKQLQQLKIITALKQEEVEALLKSYKEGDEQNRIKDIFLGAIIGAIFSVLTGIIFKEKA